MTRFSWSALIAFGLATGVGVLLLLGLFSAQTTVVIPLAPSNSVPSVASEQMTSQKTFGVDSNRVHIATSETKRTEVTPVTAVATASMPAPIVPPIAKPVPAAPDFEEPSPQTVIENMRSSFRDYQSMFGGNPVGTNPEITKALNGDNPKHAKFVHPEDGLRINDRGELIDSWGTPFFFHQLSAREMEIHSAGPDRVMWTSDDLVTK